MLLTALLALLFSLASVPVARAIAIQCELIDKPTNRKRHVGAIPLAGGIVLLAGLLLGSIYLPKSNTVWAIIFLSLPTFLLGVLDDRYDLTAKIRLLVQLGIGCFMVWIFDISIFQLDGIVGSSAVVLAPIPALLFTIICTCGVLNAINMADGIDGLLGSLACISLLAISLLAYQANASPEASLAMLCFGLLLGYLAYNLSAFGVNRRIFLGDSGSMLVGMVLLVLLVDLSQGKSAAITPTSAGWLLGLPLLDTVSVMIRRALDGRSPLAAGRDHFHHVLQDLGVSRGNTLKALIAIQTIFVLIGVSANRTEAPQFIFFWLFVLVTVLQFAGISLAVKKVANGSLTENGVERRELKSS